MSQKATIGTSAVKYFGENLCLLSDTSDAPESASPVAQIHRAASLLPCSMDCLLLQPSPDDCNQGQDPPAKTLAFLFCPAPGLPPEPTLPVDSVFLSYNVESSGHMSASLIIIQPKHFRHAGIFIDSN